FLVFIFLIMLLPLLTSTLFPYTTLFRSSLRTETLNKIKISLPSLKKQNKVAKILNYFDQKIEVNENLIANLEELSQTLFKRWFIDRKSTRLNSSHVSISYAVFCLKKKKQ